MTVKGIIPYMDRRWIFGSIGLIILVGVVLFLRANLPLLVDIFPGNGETQVAASSPLRITFSEPMQAESVTEHLEIQPATRGTYDWEANTLIFTPDQPWPSGEQISVTLRAGARSLWRLPVLRGQSWSFRVSPPLLLYLWPADGPANLYAIDLLEEVSIQLTDQANGILAYDISADGAEIYYSTRLATQNSAILRLNRISGEIEPILTCTDVLCDFPQLAPQSGYLAYTRAPSNAEREPFPQQVWLLPILNGDPAPQSQAKMVSDPTHPTGVPNWSPTGLLTFHDRAAQHFVVFDPQTDEHIFLANQTGEPGTWSPDGSNFVVHEVDFWDSGPLDFTSHLWRFEYPSAQKTDLSLDLALEDVAPTFAPDGSQIAFGRKYLDEARWTPGRQLWLMDPDGRRLRQITDSPDYNHAEFAWHPNGEYLAFVRHKQTTLVEPPEIWIILPDGSDMVRLVIGGYAPQWIP